MNRKYFAAKESDIFPCDSGAAASCPIKKLSFSRGFKKSVSTLHHGAQLSFINNSLDILLNWRGFQVHNQMEYMNIFILFEMYFIPTYTAVFIIFIVYIVMTYTNYYHQRHLEGHFPQRKQPDKKESKVKTTKAKDFNQKNIHSSRKMNGQDKQIKPCLFHIKFMGCGGKNIPQISQSRLIFV